MKFVLFILLIPSLAFSSSHLVVNIEDCNTHSYGGIVSNLRVFKNGVYISELTDSLKNKTFKIFNNIEPGIYQFRYLNTYDLEVQESITIEDHKDYRIDICVNKLGELDSSFNGLVDSITPSKPLNIIVKSGGCFAISQTKLTISLKQGQYYINYSNKVSSKGKIVKQTTQFRQIGVDQISLIRNFEQELNLIDSINKNSQLKHICTSFSVYELTLGSIKKKINDSTCSWGGIWKFTNKMF